MNLEKTVEWLGLLPSTKRHAESCRPVFLDELLGMLHAMLRRYHDGQPYTKRSMIAAGYDQRYWNLAHAVLVGVGLRHGSRYRTWYSQGSFREDLRFVTQHLRLNSQGRQVEVLTPSGYWATVDLHACHFWG